MPKRSYLSILRDALLLILLSLLISGHGPMQGNPRTLSVLVRDLAGVPLNRVSVLVYVILPSYATDVSTKTNKEGIASFFLPPGRYMIAFEGTLGLQSIVPPSEQNMGAGTRGNRGGFPVYLDPSVKEYKLAFVITPGKDPYELIPLLDLTPDWEKPPVPYSYDGEMGNEVSINTTQIDQIVLEPLVPGGIIPTQPIPPALEAWQDTNGVDIETLILAAALILVFAALVGVIMIGVRQARGDEEGRTHV